MAKILVFGARGLLGTSLVPRLRAVGHKVITQGRRPPADLCLDPCDPETVNSTVYRERPDTVINLIAATHVDRCEDHPAEAFLANVRIVENIAAALRALRSERQSHLIHISTDQVYGGLGPHREDAAVPCNIYGLTKYAGELVARDVGATVLRTNFIGRSRCEGRSSLSDWIVDSLRAGKRVTVFDDVWFSPWHSSTLCDFISRVVGNPLDGVFNVGCRDGMSKADFAFQLASRLGLNCELMAVGSSASTSFRACRPFDMRMDVTRAERAFGFIAPTTDREVQTTAEEYYRA